MLRKEKSSKSNRMGNILVIRAPYLMKKEAMQKAYDEILKQMESGLVVLPAGFSVELCPKDVEVRVMDSGNDSSEWIPRYVGEGVLIPKGEKDG